MKVTNSKTKKHSKLLPLCIFLLVLLLAAGGTVLCRHQENDNAIAKERAQYAQAEKDLDALTTQIITKFGQPDDQKKVKECGYTSSDFGTGILYCNLNVYLYYPVQNHEQARNLALALRGVNDKFTSLVDEDDSVSIASSSYEMHGLNCLTDISLHSDADNLENLGYAKLSLLNSNQGALIELNCSAKHPKAEHYPLRNS